MGVEHSRAGATAITEIALWKKPAILIPIPESISHDQRTNAYAYARTGYHRGLDQLRRSGWKGHGPVPWSHRGNQGFLRALAALARAADEIGETEDGQLYIVMGCYEGETLDRVIARGPLPLTDADRAAGYGTTSQSCRPSSP